MPRVVPIRTIVRCACALAVVAALLVDGDAHDAVVDGTRWQSMCAIAYGVAAVAAATFLVWAARRPGHRRIGVATAAILIAARAGLPGLGAPAPALLGAAVALGIGSVVVHWRSDPDVLG